MKKIAYKNNCLLLWSCLAVLMLAACEKDEVSPPVISEIRNYAASPGDTLLDTLKTGQWVVVIGKNLADVSQVHFSSIPATLNRTLLTDQSIVVQVPAIPFDSVAQDKQNIVSVVSGGASATFPINIIEGPDL